MGRKRGGIQLSAPRKTLVGRKFFKLTVIGLYSYVPKSEIANRKIYWLCNCDCGSKDVIAEHNNLISGNRKSCGCMRMETLEKMWDGNSKEESFVNAIIREYKGNAKKRNLNFELTVEQFVSLMKGNCHYCGDLPNKKKKLHIKKVHSKNHFLFNGIDRVNSVLGYVIGNVVSCCRKCNIAKNNLTYQEFIEMITKIYRHSVINKNSNHS